MKVIKVGKIIDGNGNLINDGLIVVKDKIIKKVGSSKEINLKQFKNYQLIDLGKNVSAMPGMMDCHIHLCMYNNLTFKNYRVAQWEITPELQQMYMLFHAQLCLDRGNHNVKRFRINV